MTNDAMDGTAFHIFLKNVLLCPDLRAKGLLGWPKDALIKSYYGVSRNLLIKFKDDMIDETSALAQVLSDSAISSMLDMSIRSLPGDHGLPLQQVLPDVPPAMADAVNRGGEFLANLTAGTPWETVAKEMGSTLGVDSKILRAEISKDVDMLVDVISSWMDSNAGPKLLR
ncbi:hypothetical protein C3L33_13812, partial [Rhododendron williamsianum]